MASKRSRKKPAEETAPPNTIALDSDATDVSPSGGEGLKAIPSVGLKRIVGIIIALHFASLIVAWSGNLAPSLLVGELQSWLSPYHVSTGQDHIMLPLDLVHSASMESPTLLQYRSKGSSVWQTIPLPGLRSNNELEGELLPSDYSGARSRWGNLSRLLAWIAIEQPGSEVIPAFLLQALRCAEGRGHLRSPELLVEVRMFQPHPLTFDEHRTLLINPRLASMVHEQLSGKTLYSANVFRGSNGDWQLVSREEAHRVAVPGEPSLPSVPIGRQADAEGES